MSKNFNNNNVTSFEYINLFIQFNKTLFIIHMYAQLNHAKYNNNRIVVCFNFGRIYSF